MKVVIDTNVVVSANLSDEGLPAAILDLAASKTILMFVSPAILAEYEAVLRRPHLNLSPCCRGQIPGRHPQHQPLSQTRPPLGRSSGRD